MFDDAPSWGAVPAGEEAASLQAATVAAIDALRWVGDVWQHMQARESVEGQRAVAVGAVQADEVTAGVLREALQAARQREAQWYEEPAMVSGGSKNPGEAVADFKVRLKVQAS